MMGLLKGNKLVIFSYLLTATSVHGYEDEIKSRRLDEFAAVAGYTPKSLVTDHFAIDFDQAAMEKELGFGTPDSYELAKTVYLEGGNSKSYAAVTLDPALSVSIAKGSDITGTTEDGANVYGKALDDFSVDDTEIHIQYITNADQANHVSCRVGGLSDKTSTEPQYDGCLADSGTLTLSTGESISYSYDKTVDNKNDRTLAGLSTNAKEKMAECDNCPYPSYDAFYKYYGAYDYAHQYVMAAFDSVETTFDNGNADFSQYNFDGRTQIIKKGTSYMHSNMYAMAKMEHALDLCNSNSDTSKEDAVHEWDKAFAYYTGSKEDVDGSGSGKFIWALADKRCVNFRTCGDNFDAVEGPSRVNQNILRLFKEGQANLGNGMCAEAQKNKEDVENQYKIPLIQGSLRYSYIQLTEQFGDKSQAEGSVFMASVIPYVHECNADDAQIIYDQMKVGAHKNLPDGTRIDFSALKEAFENNYNCLGVTCEEVGGIYKSVEKVYDVGGEPCGTTSESGDSSSVDSEGYLHLPLGTIFYAISGLLTFFL